jgi:membrane protein implicated in regulation of membrane protease activity
MVYYYWFIAALILSLIEIITPGFVILWFGVSAGIVGVLDLLGVHEPLIQAILFVIFSLALVILSRTFFKKTFVRSPGKQYKTNVDVLIGKKAIVSLEIDNGKGEGRVLVEGQDWAARSESGEIIPTGSSVEIIRYEGVKLFVNIIH